MPVSVPMGGMCRVWMETPDGKVVEMTAQMVRFETQCNSSPLMYGTDIYGPVMSRVEFIIDGPINWSSAREMKKKVTAQRTAKEYKCAYCGVANPISNTQCSCCGGARDFLIGE